MSLLLSIKTNNIVVLKVLLDQRVDYNNIYNGPFQMAVRLNNLNIIDMILDLPYDLAIRQQSLNKSLEIAVENNNIETVKHLLDRGAKVDNSDPQHVNRTFMYVTTRDMFYMLWPHKVGNLFDKSVLMYYAGYNDPLYYDYSMMLVNRV
jgi:hypothetical protein